MAISTTVDQVLSSASNALMVFVLAQVSSAGQFGIIGLLISVLAFCITFDRGALGTPLLLTSNLTNRQIVAESNYALTWSLYTGGVGGFLILTLGAIFHHPWIGLAFAVALPVVLAQDVLRLTAIALGRPNLAVVADALWVAPMLGIFVANLVGVHEVPHVLHQTKHIIVTGLNEESFPFFTTACCVLSRHFHPIDAGHIRLDIVL